MSIWRKLAGFEDVNKNDKPKIEKVKKNTMLNGINIQAENKTTSQKNIDTQKKKTKYSFSSLYSGRIDRLNFFLANLFIAGIYFIVKEFEYLPIGK